VLCILADGFEEIEAVTVIDLLRRAEIPVMVAGVENHKIQGAHQISIECDIQLKDVDLDQFTHLFLPGGQPGTDNLKKNKFVIEVIRRFHRARKVIAAICAAPTVLLEAGIIKNYKITSYPDERAKFVDSVYIENDVVYDKNVITSRGVGTAIQFALYMIESMTDKETSQTLADRILYNG